MGTAWILLADDKDKVAGHFYEHPRLGRQDLDPRLVALLDTRRLFTKMDWHGRGAFTTGAWDGEETTDLGVADLVTSESRFNRGWHALLLDIDHPLMVWTPGSRQRHHDGDKATAYVGDGRSVSFSLPPNDGAWVIPSTTEGKHHLYVSCDLTWPDLTALLCALADQGVIEPGYRDASINRGGTSLRLPWVAKTADQPSSSGAA